MRMRVLLLGGGSRLGQALKSQAAAESITFETQECPEGGWQPDHVEGLLDAGQPQVVINLAYYHEQFQLGTQDALLLAGQHAFSERLISVCAARDIVPFLVSSARVFDGLKASPYSEKDEVGPADALGELQAALEKAALAATDRHLVLRFSWVLDDSPDGLLGRLMQQLCRQEVVELAEEWRGNPTPVEDAARVMLALLKQLDCEAPIHGIYHYGSSEVSSWISFAKSLIQELLASNRLDHDLLVQPVPFATQTMAGREPQNAALVCRRILMTCGVKPRAWRTQLPALLETFEFPSK